MTTENAGEPVNGTVPSRLSGTFAIESLTRGEPTVSELADPAEFQDDDSETGIEAAQGRFEAELPGGQRIYLRNGHF